MSGKKLVIAAAGTGGHVMPGLAVAREMRRRGWDIEWIGTQTGMEGGLAATLPFPCARGPKASRHRSC